MKNQTKSMSPPLRMIRKTALALLIGGICHPLAAVTVDLEPADQVEKKAPEVVQQDRSDDTFPVNGNTNSVQLGNDFHSKENRIAGVSSSIYVQGVPKTLGNSHSMVKLAFEQSAEEILESLSGSASLEANIGALTLSGSFAGAQEVTSDNKSMTLSVIARVKPKTLVLVPEEEDIAGLEGQNVYGTGEGFSANPSRLDEDGSKLGDGDSFVQAIDYTAWVVVTIKYHFASAEEKESLSASLEAEWSAGVADLKAGATFDMTSLMSGKNISMSVHAAQLGGQSLNLGQATFCGDEAESFATCESYVSSALEYIRTGFVQQLVDEPLLSENNEVSAHWAPAQIHVLKYKDTGPDLNFMQSDVEHLSFHSKVARKQMFNALRKAKADAHLLAGIDAGFDSSLSAELTELQSAVNNNITQLTSKLSTCLTSEFANKCSWEWGDRGIWLSNYDRTLLKR